jgi:hypothetical protein
MVADLGLAEPYLQASPGMGSTRSRQAQSAGAKADYWLGGSGGDIYYSSGDVGIGTSAPDSVLHARSAASSIMLFEGTGTVSRAAGVVPEATGSRINFIGYTDPSVATAQTSMGGFQVKITDQDPNPLKTELRFLHNNGDTINEAMLVRDDGIVDLNKQSRVRAHLRNHNQTIPAGTWVAVEFDNDSHLPVGYDEHDEFTVWTDTPEPTNAVFTATSAGYYQVNAGIEFYYFSGTIEPNSHAEISIVVNRGAPPHTSIVHTSRYQMMPHIDSVPYYPGLDISEIVKLEAGDEVIILALQNLVSSGGVVYILSSWSGTYVSIHKLS